MIGKKDLIATLEARLLDIEEILPGVKIKADNYEADEIGFTTRVHVFNRLVSVRYQLSEAIRYLNGTAPRTTA